MWPPSVFAQSGRGRAACGATVRFVRDLRARGAMDPRDKPEDDGCGCCGLQRFCAIRGACLIETQGKPSRRRWLAAAVKHAPRSSRCLSPGPIARPDPVKRCAVQPCGLSETSALAVPWIPGTSPRMTTVGVVASIGFCAIRTRPCGVRRDRAACPRPLRPRCHGSPGQARGCRPCLPWRGGAGLERSTVHTVVIPVLVTGTHRAAGPGQAVCGAIVRFVRDLRPAAAWVAGTSPRMTAVLALERRCRSREVNSSHRGHPGACHRDPSRGRTRSSGVRCSRAVCPRPRRSRCHGSPEQARG